MLPIEPPGWLAPYVMIVGGCWVMRRGIEKNGYAKLSIGGKSQWAHRWVYTRCVGPIEPLKQLDHLCRTTACVRPDHLQVVTASENMKRSSAGLKLGSLNGNKTHCVNGHEFSIDNTYYRPTGGRSCRACLRIRRGYTGTARPKIDRDHCPKGHAYDVENTAYDKKHHRRCKECNRMNARQQKQKRTSEQASRQVAD